jgi:oligopeptide transport system substrate-binding protein
VVAGDFEYSLKRLLDPKLEAYAAGSFYDIRGAAKYNSCLECEEEELTALRKDVGVSAPNNTTLVITLSSPRVTLPYLLAGLAASPLRRDLVEGNPLNWTSPSKLISAGPFVLSEQSSEQIVLLPNPHWWGKSVKLDRVTIKIVPDPADALSLYLAGELDAVEVSPELQATVDADPKLIKQSSEQPSLQSSAYFLNLAQPPFDEPMVRQAFSVAVDREAFAKEVEGGTTLVAYSWLPKGMPGHEASLGRQWRFDPDKARKLLVDAGYPDGQGLPKITYAYGTVGNNAAYAEFLRDQLKANLGVTIELQPMEISAWREKFFSGQLQIAYLGWSAEYADPEDFLRELWTCQRYESGNCTAYADNNLVEYANPEFDRLMQLAAKESDAKRRLRSYAQAEKVLVADAPAIFMTNGVRRILIKPYVGGAVNTPLDAMVMEFFLDRAYVKH